MPFRSPAITFAKPARPAIEEIAFTLSNAKAYLQAARDAGIALDDVAPRVSFFWNAHNDFFEEIAKFRAARYLWAQITRDEFGCKDPRSQMLRFHTQTGGSTLTAQEPDNNVVRVALQALAAVLGGTQSLHTNGKDEALALPTAESAKLALRTQQVIAYESGVADVVDPMAGSYYVESLTNELIDRARAIIAEVDALGGSIATIESGWMQARIADSAYAAQQAIERGEQVVVGVNRFAEDSGATSIALQRVDDRVEREQVRAAGSLSRGSRFGRRRSASWQNSAPQREAAKTSCRYSSMRSMPARRSARFATCCARSSAPIARARWLRKDADRPRRHRRQRSRSNGPPVYADAGLSRRFIARSSPIKASKPSGWRPAPRSSSSFCRSTKARRSPASAARPRPSCTTPPTASPTSKRRCATSKPRACA